MQDNTDLTNAIKQHKEDIDKFNSIVPNFSDDSDLSDAINKFHSSINKIENTPTSEQMNMGMLIEWTGGDRISPRRLNNSPSSSTNDSDDELPHLEPLRVDTIGNINIGSWSADRIGNIITGTNTIITSSVPEGYNNGNNGITSGTITDNSNLLPNFLIPGNNGIFIGHHDGYTTSVTLENKNGHVINVPKEKQTITIESKSSPVNPDNYTTSVTLENKNGYVINVPKKEVKREPNITIESDSVVSNKIIQRHMLEGKYNKLFDAIKNLDDPSNSEKIKKMLTKMKMFPTVAPKIKNDTGEYLTLDQDGSLLWKKAENILDEFMNKKNTSYPKKRGSPPLKKSNPKRRSPKPIVKEYTFSEPPKITNVPPRPIKKPLSYISNDAYLTKRFGERKEGETIEQWIARGTQKPNEEIFIHDGKDEKDEKID